jgi:hypothetical protein
MLTSEAYLERKWRGLPLLRRALANKRVSDAELFTSIDETLPERLGELLDIACLVAQERRDVAELATVEPPELIHREIEHVVGELRAAALRLNSLAEDVYSLHEDVERAWRERERS